VQEPACLTEYALCLAKSRNEDRHSDESSLFGTACNLDGHKAYRVSGSHRWDNAKPDS